MFKGLTNKLRKKLIRIIECYLPDRYQLPLRMIYYRSRNLLDPEMLYIDKIIENNERFLDVGANMGVYSYFFRNKFKNIEAFEPLREASYTLKAINSDKIKIHNMGLSNKKGNVIFHIPLVNGKLLPGLASLEERDCICEDRLINVNTIDSFSFNDISLIKIDAEGHELSILEGSLKTIERCKPIMLVEIEQRHLKKGIKEVFSCFLDLDYIGFFLKENKLTPITEFDYEVHQKPFLKNPLNKSYINNFIFMPKQKKRN